MFRSKYLSNLLKNENARSAGKRNSAKIEVSPENMSTAENHELKENRSADFCEKLNSVQKSGDCDCQNCANLPIYTECGVCMNPLQGSKILSCTICANLICKSCSSRLNTCAFCRGTKPMERNRAIERLLEKLQLPCKNSRFGCEMFLVGESRLPHEQICNFTGIQCPLESTCNWYGPVVSTQSHFDKSHNLLVINDYKITINIDEFQNKSIARSGKLYMGSLKCYGQLFFFKVILHKQKLKISFCRLGYLYPITTHDNKHVYSMRLDVLGGDRVNVFAHYDFENSDCYNFSAISINCKLFYKKILDKTTNNADNVKITISIEKDFKKSAKVKKCPCTG